MNLGANVIKSTLKILENFHVIYLGQFYVCFPGMLGVNREIYVDFFYMIIFVCFKYIIVDYMRLTGQFSNSTYLNQVIAGGGDVWVFQINIAEIVFFV